MENKSVFFNFAPHLGDLLISRGLANGLKREKGEGSVSCTYLTDKDLYEYLQSPNFEIRYSKDKKDYDRPIIHEGMKLDKYYLGSNKFQYVYTPTDKFLKSLIGTIESQLKDGVFDGIQKIYSLHMQFDVIFLGYYLSKYYGVEAQGYKFTEKDGLYYLNVDNVYYKDGIIRHMGEVLGITPKFEDFILSKGNKVETDTVLLLAGSRRTDGLSNQHWDLAEEFFNKEGYQVTKAEYQKDYHSIGELIELMNENRVVVTNDSFPYHLAWSLEKDIILKEKLGVLSEWTHKGYKGKSYSIPPAPVFEEGYIQHLINAMELFKG